MIPQTTANEIFSAMTGKASFSAPSEVFLGYCVNEPNDVSGAISGEPSNDTGYARLSIKNSYETFFSTASGGIITNSKEIRMPTAQVDQGTHYYWFLSKSGANGGACYLYGELMHKDKTSGQYVAGLPIGEETVPVFYKGYLRASLDVALPPRP